MPDPAEQIRHLHEAGFSLETFDRYPKHVAAVRDGCIALLEITAAGLNMTGTPGWRMGELMGVLVERSGRQFFQAKAETREASPEMLQALRRFRAELEELLIRRV